MNKYVNKMCIRCKITEIVCLAGGLGCVGVCEESWGILWECCSQKVDRVLTGNPIFSEHTLTVLCRWDLSCKVTEWNQQLIENVKILSMKE